MTSPVSPKYPFASTLDSISGLLTAANKPHLIAPRVGIVCGSGLSTLASQLRDSIEIPYTSLPGFGKSTGAHLYMIDRVHRCSPDRWSTVDGHKSILAFGLLGPGEGVPVVVMLGRVGSHQLKFLESVHETDYVMKVPSV